MPKHTDRPVNPLALEAFLDGDLIKACSIVCKADPATIFAEFPKFFAFIDVFVMAEIKKDKKKDKKKAKKKGIQEESKQSVDDSVPKEISI